MIKAVVFDLDDTLVPEIEYVKSGFKAIAEALGDDQLYLTLFSLFERNRENVYQRAGLTEEQCKRCIEIYREHMPKLTLSHEGKQVIDNLKRKKIKLGIITDGRPIGQHNKIKALGLNELMDYIIVTDELGGPEYRKPNPKAFEIMRQKLDVEFHEMVYVGDNPSKDFYIGSIYPIKTVRMVSGGLYTEYEYFNQVREQLTIFDFEDLLKIVFMEENSCDIRNKRYAECATRDI